MPNKTAKLRGNMHAADYKHVFLGPIFLDYISDVFHKHYEKLKEEPHAFPEDRLLVPLPPSFPRLQRHIAPIPAC